MNKKINYVKPTNWTMKLTKFKQILGINEFEQDLELANMRQSTNAF